MSNSARISDVEVLFFTKHLAVMVKAGIPLTEALGNLEKDAKGQLKKVIAKIAAQVEKGESLVHAITVASPSFDSIYLAMVGIGEESGTLDTSLNFLANQLNKIYTLRRKIKGAMLYPMLVLGLMVSIAAALSVFVLPKLIEFFSAFETKLPLSTRILLWFATLMKNYGIIIISAVILLTIGFNLLIRSRAVKPWWHKVILKLPYVGKMNQNSATAEVMRNIGILLSSGIPIMRAWEIVIGSSRNEYMKRELSKVADRIQKGSMVGESMQKLKVWVIPYMAQRMLAVGERTGKIDEMALYMAEYYEEELDNSSKNLTTVLEPILLVVVSLMVAFLALAIIGPIYQITGSIGG